MQTNVPYRLHVLRLAGTVLLSASISSAAAQSGTPGQDHLVHDGAHVMQPAVVAQLEQRLRRYADSTGVELAVVTVKSLHGQEIGQVGDSLKNALGIGSKQTQRGILYLIAPSVPRQTIRTGRGLEADLPDALCFRILKQSQPTLRQDPQAAILSRVAGIQRQLAVAARAEAAYAQPAVTVTAADEENAAPVWALLLIFGVVGLTIALVRRRLDQAQEESDRLERLARCERLARGLSEPTITLLSQGAVMGRAPRKESSPTPRHTESTDSPVTFWGSSDDDSTRKTSDTSSGWGSSGWGSDDTSSSSDFSFGGDSDGGGGGASSD